MIYKKKRKGFLFYFCIANIRTLIEVRKYFKENFQENEVFENQNF